MMEITINRLWVCNLFSQCSHWISTAGSLIGNLHIEGTPPAENRRRSCDREVEPERIGFGVTVPMFKCFHNMVCFD